MIYCISLDRCTERWHFVQEQAQRLGVQIERFSAVDARDPANAEALGALAAIGPMGPLGLGTLACSLSHTRVWAQIDRPSIILEDDAILSDDFADVAQAVLAQNDFDLVKLDAHPSTEAGVIVGPRAPLTARRGLRRCHHLATGAAAYAITPAGARQALERFSAARVPVDHFLFYPRNVKGFAGIPYAILDAPCVAQAPEVPSQIEAQRSLRPTARVELGRAGYEAAQAPGMIRALIGGARVRKLRFEA